MTAPPLLPSFYHLRALAQVDSTNDEAKRRAAEGAPEGTLIWAREQTAGRGRRGRGFVSPPGNLYFSVVLRPERSAVAAAQLGFAAAIAIGEAALLHLPPGVKLAYKWPNDVLLDGRKTSGILLESQAAADGRLAWLILGIGINLVSFPEGTEYPATSLAAAGAGTVLPETMLEGVAGNLHLWYERWRDHGFSALREAWLKRVHGFGEAIRVRLSHEEMTGRFAGLDEDGVLLLDVAGERRRITAGDVFPANR